MAIQYLIIYAVYNMNFIDQYNGHVLPTIQQQRFVTNIKIPEDSIYENIPFYLKYMKLKFLEEYINTTIFIYESEYIQNKCEQKQGFAISILDNKIRHKMYQYFIEIIINEKNQSILVKGSFLKNNQIAKIKSMQQISMCMRKIFNINSDLSPLKVMADPYSGSIHLFNCSYVDVQFDVINHSQKNLIFITARISLLVKNMLNRMPLLVYLVDQESVAPLYQSKMKPCFIASIAKANNNIQKLQNSLYKIFLNLKNPNDSNLNSNNKQFEVMKYHQEFNQQIKDILQLYEPFYERIEYKKIEEINKLSTQKYDKSIVSYMTEVQKKLQFKIHTKIQFAKAENVVWKEIARGGFGRVQVGNARIYISDKQQNQLPIYNGDGSTQEEQVKKSSSTFRKIDDQEDFHHQKSQLSVKLARKSDLVYDDNSERIERQKNILNQFVNKIHPNIITYLSTDSTSDKKYIYNIYEENQSMQALLEKCKGTTLFQKLFLLEQAAKGLLFLHKNKIIHLDFKPGNLVVGKRFLLKLCDFGQSFIVNQSNQNHKFGRSFPFAPPQMYHAKKTFNFNMDIYSLGVSIYRCLFQEHVWKTISNKDSFLKLLKLQGAVLPCIVPERYNEFGFKRIIKILVFLCLKCIEQNPKKRPSLQWLITAIQQAKKCLQDMYYS